MIDQDNDNFYLLSLSFLVTCLLDNVSTIKGEDTYKSCVGLKELITISDTVLTVM